MAHPYSIASITSALNSLILSDSRAFRRSYNWELYFLTLAQAAPMRRLILVSRCALSLIPPPRYTNSAVCLYRCPAASIRSAFDAALGWDHRVMGSVLFSDTFIFYFFYFISLIADGPHHYHPACGHKGSSHLSPVHALQFFYRDASSALLQLVNQWLNFTYSRSHAFRYERKNTKSYFGKNRTHDFRTSRCAAYLLDHSGDDCQYEFLICDNYNVHHPGKPTR